MRYSPNLALPLGLSLVKSSLNIRPGIANPRIHPMGKAIPPRAVDSPLSLSPNHVVASLLKELTKNTYPRAATIVPMMTTSNLPVKKTSCLRQAPARVIAAPIIIYKE